MNSNWKLLVCAAIMSLVIGWDSELSGFGRATLPVVVGLFGLGLLLPSPWGLSAAKCDVMRIAECNVSCRFAFANGSFKGHIVASWAEPSGGLGVGVRLMPWLFACLLLALFRAAV